MSTDQLVFLKSRNRRLAEMMILPVAILPLGPILRALLGNRYEVLYGLVAMMLASLILTRVSSQWTGVHGEWVTKGERLRRILAEAEEARWLYALATTAMLPLSLLGILLVIEPIDHLGDALGGPRVTALVVGAAAAIGGGRVLYSGYSKSQPTVVDETPPPGHFWSDLRSALPLTYAAYALGTVAALLVAMQFDGPTQFAAFIVVFLIASQLPLTVLRRAGKRVYPVVLEASLGRQVLAGALLWGVPMGMMFSAAIALEFFGLPVRITLTLKIALVALVMGLSVVGGAALGVFLHFMLRVSKRKAL